MNTRILKIIFLVICLVCVSGLFAQKRWDEKDLPPQHRDFLDLVRYIILENEQDVFLRLDTNRDRDIFIESFWKQRDPTPGTPQNEYKEEHIKRFNYANSTLGRGSSRVGWRSDQGKFYIILGEPSSKHRFYGKRGVYPCEVWYYYGDKTKGLPTYFGIVFFKRKGVGEYELYDPVSDGISALLMNTEGMSFDDYFGLYERLDEFIPELAPVAISMIPGEIPMNYVPSPQNMMIVADILDAPKKDVSTKYATHFLNFKGIVSTEYMSNYIENITQVDILREPVSGLNFLNFSIFPKTLSFDYYQPDDQYFCNFKLDVSLRKGEDVIFQYSKDFPIYIPPDEVQRITNSGITIEDLFPILEGDYRVVILLQNSVGKEFTVFEEDVNVPAAGGTPRISGPVLGYDVREHPTSSLLPYKMLDKKLIIDPGGTFSNSEEVTFFLTVFNVDKELWESGQINVIVKGMKPTNPTVKNYTLRLNQSPYRSSLPFSKTLVGSDLTPDYYEIEMVLVNGDGEILDNQSTQFIVSPEEAVSHPTTQAKSFPLANSFLFYFVLGDQYDLIQNFERAEHFYQTGFDLNPNFKRGLVTYAHFLIRQRNFEKSLEMVEKLLGDPETKYDYHLIKGIAFLELGRFDEALQNLLEGNKIYNSDILLLNALGHAYHNTNQDDKALDVLKASLRLNPNQPEISKLLEEWEKKSE